MGKLSVKVYVNSHDYPVQVNTGTTISGSLMPGVDMYITNALGNFTANGQAIAVTGGQAINFTSPFRVTGDVTSTTAGKIFYYFA